MFFHAEIGAAMSDEGIEFLEALLVQQQVNPFARGQLALGVLRGNPFVATALIRRRAPGFEFLQDVAHVILPLSLWGRLCCIGRAGKQEWANLQTNRSSILHNCNIANCRSGVVCVGQPSAAGLVMCNDR